MDLLNIVNNFNNGETEFIEDYFGDYDTFFKFLEKRKLLNLIDPGADNYEKWQNKFFLFLINNDKEVFVEILKNTVPYTLLDDVNFINGEPYIEVASPVSFSSLFCKNRNVSQDFISSILSNEYDHSFYDIPCDINDLISDLSPENLTILKKYVINNLKDTRIEPEGNLLSSIADAQGNDFLIVNESNVDEILEDEFSSKYIIENYLYDLDNNLCNIYFNAYNDAYYDVVRKEVYDKLSIYFDENGEWVPIKGGNRQYYRAKIVDFFDTIGYFLKDNLNNYNTLSNYGNYLSILEDGFECISYYPSDYPDYRLVKKYINDMFPDYIY